VLRNGAFKRAAGTSIRSQHYSQGEVQLKGGREGGREREREKREKERQRARGKRERVPCCSDAEKMAMAQSVEDSEGTGLFFEGGLN